MDVVEVVEYKTTSYDDDDYYYETRSPETNPKRIASVDEDLFKSIRQPPTPVSELEWQEEVELEQFIDEEFEGPYSEDPYSTQVPEEEYEDDFVDRDFDAPLVYQSGHEMKAVSRETKKKNHAKARFEAFNTFNQPEDLNPLVHKDMYRNSATKLPGPPIKPVFTGRKEK